MTAPTALQAHLALDKSTTPLRGKPLLQWMGTPKKSEPDNEGCYASHTPKNS